MQDVAPELIEAIRRDFLKLFGETELASLTYKGAADYAERVGTALAQAFQNNLSSAVLPDGRMYYNIAQRVVRPMLEQDHALVAEAAAQAQKAMNEAAGLGLKPIKAPLNTDRIDGIINKISAAEQYDDVAWMLAEPVVTFSRAVVDDTLKANVDFQGKAGLKPKIIRRAEAKCCAWCSNLAGTYTYPDVPRDVYRRHESCRCTVEYDPGGAKKKNVHTKQWTDPNESGILESRKVIGLRVNGVTIQSVSLHCADQMLSRNVLMDSVKDAIQNPLQIKPVKYDELGRASFAVVGRKATVTINPDTGVMSTAHPTHTNTAKKLLGKKGET